MAANKHMPFILNVLITLLDNSMDKGHTYHEAEHEFECNPYKFSKLSASLLEELVFSKCNSNSFCPSGS
jgi:hypothetical protein